MKRKTKEEFITESIAAHGVKYDYIEVDYKNNHSLIIIMCREHGSFTTTPKNHIKHYVGCPVCGISAIKYKQYTDSVKKTHEQFLLDAYKIHGDRYDYSMCNYESGRQKMPIICKQHGVFMQHAEGHIHRKQGCMKCYRARQTGSTGKSGYCSTFFESYPEKKSLPAIIYVARMQHKLDDFLKVGITVKKGVKERFYTKSKNGTVITPLIESPMTLYDAFLKEQTIIKDLAVNHRYFPNRKFGGYTECFKINDDTVKYINELFNADIVIDK